MCKHNEILEQLVFKHHPAYKSKAIQKHALDNPKHYDVTHLTEEVIAIASGLTHSPGRGRDFSDGTDSKTASVCFKKSINAYKGVISGVEVKESGLRVVVYNRFSSNRLAYFYIPKAAVQIFKNTNGQKGSEEICFSWSPSRGYSRLEGYRYETFEEMCKATEDDFE